MMVAKKCKHCGEWLDGRNHSTPSRETTDHILQDFEDEIKRTHKKKMIILLCAGALFLVLIVWLVIKSNQDSTSDMTQYNLTETEQLYDSESYEDVPNYTFIDITRSDAYDLNSDANVWR